MAVPLWTRLRNRFRRPPPVSQWYTVQFDDALVHLHADPPGRPAWSARFAWSTIVRVCFEAQDMLTSDGIYIFTADRPESYAIPLEASGGSQLFDELIRRGLFDASVAARALCSDHGLFCWPPVEEPQ